MRQTVSLYTLTAISVLGLLAPSHGQAAEGAQAATAARPAAAQTSSVAQSQAAAAKPALASKPAAGDFTHPTKAGIEFFEKKIRPVLVSKCYQCHSTAAASVKGELKLDTRDAIRKGGESGAVLIPGDSQSSLLMEALRFEGLEMPPTGKLSDQTIADFATWIDMGAPDPRTGTGANKKLSLAEARNFWAFKIPNKPPVPAVKDAAWSRTDIDRFVLAGLEKNDLHPVADADKLTWLRRVTFDLTGLPPTLAEIDSFLADTANPATAAEAEAKVVDRLLASPQYGERWGRHWLDVARYGESTGKERNIPFSYAWKYRDWVIDSVNADKPYTRFAMEQIAGDLLPAATPTAKNDQMLGTGFLALGPKSINEKNREQYLMDTVDEQIDVVTRAFLATTVGCARCHDHKFDPIPQADYYALAGIFRSTETLSGVQARSQGGNPRDYSGQLMALADSPASHHPASAAAPKPTPKSPLAGLSPEQRKEYEKIKTRIERRKELLSGLASSGKKKGDKASAKKQAKQLQQQLANDQAKLAELGAGGGTASAAGTAGDENVAMGVRDVARPADTEIRVRGEPEDKGPLVPRGFVAVLKTSITPKVNPHQSGRLEMAHWIASRDNPLTARVAVNRIWSHLFGRGIVESIDNFGALGDEPSNPQLLDYLAVRFMEGGWSSKRLIREIVLSRAYHLSSEHNEADYAKDPGNVHLWRMNRRRLDAESIRDAMLAAAGTLDLKRPHGSPIAALKPSDEIGRKASVAGMENQLAHNRSVYLPLVRNAVPESLSVFDVADPSLVVGRREVTTVATQALYLMNSGFAEQQAEQTAERLLSTGLSDDNLRIEWAYRTILGRGATAAERSRGAQFVKEFAAAAGADSQIAANQRDVRAWSALCQALMASAEFRYLY